MPTTATLPRRVRVLMCRHPERSRPKGGVAEGPFLVASHSVANWKKGPSASLRYARDDGTSLAVLRRDLEAQETCAIEAQHVGPRTIGELPHGAFDRLGRVRPGAFVVRIV